MYFLVILPSGSVQFSFRWYNHVAQERSWMNSWNIMQICSFSQQNWFSQIYFLYNWSFAWQWLIQCQTSIYAMVFILEVLLQDIVKLDSCLQFQLEFNCFFGLYYVCKLNFSLLLPTCDLDFEFSLHHCSWTRAISADGSWKWKWIRKCNYVSMKHFMKW